jgi:hypothetical protein
MPWIEAFASCPDLVRVLLGKIHGDVAAHGMPDHRETVVVGVGLDLPHFLHCKSDIGNAALNLRETSDLELADLGHHGRIAWQIVLDARQHMGDSSRDEHLL